MRCLCLQNQNDEMMKYKSLSDKHLEMFLVMDSWIECMQKNKNIESYLKKCDISNIIIYGMGYIGKRLYKDIKSKQFNIICCDNNEIVCSNYNIKDEGELDPQIIIVTAIYNFFDIKKELDLRYSCVIISFDDLINRILISKDSSN